MRSIRIAIGGAILIAATANAGAQTARTDPHANSLSLLVIDQGRIAEPSRIVTDKLAPKASAKPNKGVLTGRSRPASPTPASKSNVPVMVAGPEAQAARPQGTGSWLLLCMLGGGVVGAAVVWFVRGSAKVRTHPTPRRKEQADQAMGPHSASANDDRRDDRAFAYSRRRPPPSNVRASGYDEHWAPSRERQETAPPRRPNRASAYDVRRERSRVTDETVPRGGHDRASAYDSRRVGSKESDETGEHAPAYDSHRASSERQEAEQPSRYNPGSAYDAFWDALRDGRETDRPSRHTAAGTPVERAPPGATQPRVAAKRQPNADNMLYDSLEQEITTLLGRPTGKNSQRQEAAQPGGRNAASADVAVAAGWSRSATPVEPNPLDLPYAVETRQPYADKMFHESLEQEITSLLGRSSGKNSSGAKADPPRGRNAASTYDAVRDALGESQQADQLTRRNGASAYDAVSGALSEGEEGVDQPSNRNMAFAYDAVRDALSEGEEVDQPSDHNAASSHDAVRDALGEREEANELLGAMRLLHRNPSVRL
jgi:hypothetical protein